MRGGEEEGREWEKEKEKEEEWDERRGTRTTADYCGRRQAAHTHPNSAANLPTQPFIQIALRRRL